MESRPNGGSSSGKGIPVDSPHLPPVGNWFRVRVVFLAGVAAGVSSALFLVLLEEVTRLHQSHPNLLWGLPILGAVGAMAYRSWGGKAGQGMGLILEAHRNPEVLVPLRMAPLVLAGTLLTHLGGGSAGREGTAVQMAVGLLAGITRRLGWSGADSRFLVECAIAAGFGAVFGTPSAGAVFAIEVPRQGLAAWRRLPWTLASAGLAHGTCLLCGVQHSGYPAAAGAVSWEPIVWGQAVLVGIVSGLVARGFVRATRGVTGSWTRFGIGESWRPVIAGILLVLCGSLPGFSPYLGLGVESPVPGPSILTAFHQGGATPWSWLWKLLFTALTVASGFRGGEVTPLFFVGATLGNSVATCFGWPVGFPAALGFVAVFAGASHAPLACMAMAAELFGIGFLPAAALACWIAHRMAGAGIYPNRIAPEPDSARKP